MALAFTREASSAEVALMTALADVHTGIPKAQLIEVAPDFVGLTDVAEAIGVTRQNMRKLMVSHAATFPVPVHEGATSLWHLADVLSWLREKGNYTWAEGLLDVALVAKQINLALASRQLQSRMQRRIAELVD